MATDLTLPVREAGVVFLRAQGSLTALLPVSSIYGTEQPPNPPYPFVKFGQPTTDPLEYTCQDGCTVTADLHVFAETEAEAHAIGEELVLVLDEATLDLGGGREATARWTAGLSLRDPEDERLWHIVRTFEFEASE